MAETVGALLKAGGLIAAALLAVPGASAYFIGGGVIYTHRAREALLEVRLANDPDMRASTGPYALLCATAVRERLGVTWGLGETGAAGPSGNRSGDPAGHCCIAVTGPRTRVITLKTGRSEREANMWRFAGAALALLEETIRGD
jgi:nicotinamide-nucleotide amidase